MNKVVLLPGTSKINPSPLSLSPLSGPLCPWLSEGVPSSIRAHSRQDPKRSYATAIRFDVMEAYLLSLIEKIEQ